MPNNDDEVRDAIQRASSKVFATDPDYTILPVELEDLAEFFKALIKEDAVMRMMVNTYKEESRLAGQSADQCMSAAFLALARECGK